MTQLVQLAPPAEASTSAPGSGPNASGPLTDTFGRVHSDLRVSVTDRCNIRCFYCMPEEGAEFAPVARLLTFGQILSFVEAALPLGICKIRLTGGEPLLRPRLPELIEGLTRLGDVKDLALTTNGVLLAKHAGALYDAGLRRLNIHLDTLDRQRFHQITRRDDLRKVMNGLETALSLGFRSIKLNAVAVKGLTEQDVVPLVRFGREHGIEVRFIEFMPLDAQELWSLDRVLTADQMISMIEAEFGKLMAVPDADPRAPATEYQFVDGTRVGFIASVSRPFCLNCNRVRLTSDGKLRYCLFAREETDVSDLLRRSAPAQELQEVIRETVWRKWIGHEINHSGFQAPQRPMYSIGG